MTAKATPVTTSNPTMDGEHRIQVDLINALCTATEAGAAEAEIGRILEQLVAYSEAHFMSEELLMRLDSYDDFEEHVEEHSRMMDLLQEMLTKHRAGKSALLPSLARPALDFLLQHIETRDLRYTQWVRS